MHEVSHLITEIGKKCQEKKLSLVTAESCTAGGLAFNIVKNPSSSSILERGYIVYSITAKADMLDISSYMLQTYGLVSKEIAEEMAKKALEKSKAQISIAITGIDEDAAQLEDGKKSGIVWISCAGLNKNMLTKEFKISGHRVKFCNTAILEGLKLLLHFIK